MSPKDSGAAREREKQARAAQTARLQALAGAEMKEGKRGTELDTDKTNELIVPQVPGA